MRELTAISTGTQVCAIIGNPVSHSLSPAIHNAAFEAMGLNFVYVAFRVEDVKSALAGMRALENFRGMSVTIPHKIETMKYMDEISPLDRHIGSINTVINEKGRLTGLGTDGPGALKAIRDAGVELDGKSVLMLGAGGASRAIAFTLAQNADLREISLLDIDRDMIKQLAADLDAGTKTRIRADMMSDASINSNMKGADLIINCTPVGMHPKEDSSLVPVGCFRPGQVVFDVVYTPLKTRLLKDAEASGLKIIAGVDMFINQAILQFERFTGVNAPEGVMRRVVMEHLKS
ncbi:Shikimate dehydrogenase [uncultured Desulfobacterium sp.]|uniref:Shikimate dehydrogenase (NADP(+)) n=1 Tax=uncultured Desulfobacterium sp. TaxID=201089 RepID=A0A445MW65_9BACT|nr:Shikimate dehydrogenase [uncultured Desulfobacterium sp.]